MKEVTEWSELQALLNSNRTVIVDVFATWCGPCKKIAPIFEAASKQYPEILFVKTNCSDSQEIAHQLDVSSIPTFIVFVDGEETDRMSGGNIDRLRALIAKYG